MADTHETAADVQAHVNSWNGFKAMMTWGTLGVAIIAALVVFGIAS